jgi:arsenate reductase
MIVGRLRGPDLLPTVAFVCVHNAGRSQMAAAWARRLGPPNLHVISGGTEPATHVNPKVVQAMGEVGIDLSGVVPHKLSFDEAMHADYFITMGCSREEACPAGYRGDVRDWALPDPKGKSIEEVRAIRDAIEARVREFLVEIAPAKEARRGGSR